MEQDYHYPIWAWGLIIIVTILFLPFSLISMGIFLMCKDFFTEWALEIGDNPLYIFFLVFVLGIIGHAIYYIRYRLYCSQNSYYSKEIPFKSQL